MTIREHGPRPMPLTFLVISFSVNESVIIIAMYKVVKGLAIDLLVASLQQYFKTM